MVTRSIDDTEDVYPVIFTPNDWAKYLGTDFRPEDLPRNQLRDAEKRHSILTAHRDALMSGQQDIKGLEKAVADAGNALRTSQAAMAKGYSDTAISCIQLYFTKAAIKAQNKIAAFRTLTDTNRDELNATLKQFSQPPLSVEQWKSLIEMQSTCLQNQANLATASDAYYYAQTTVSVARADDLATSLTLINVSIESLTTDIEGYQKMLQASENPAPETNLSPPSQDDSSIWQYFVISSKAGDASNKTLSTSSDPAIDYSTGPWFGSGSGHSDTAENKKTAISQIMDVQIGFRAMKVTIDRPWFDAHVLGQTKEFSHSSANSISAGKPQDIQAALASGEAVDDSNSIIPSWATGFVVVKDVHVVMSSHSKFDESEVSAIKNSLSSGGGFLCFQSKSSFSSNHPNAFSMKTSENNISIRIAAPQILGWISQLAPEDVSAKTDNTLNDGF